MLKSQIVFRRVVLINSFFFFFSLELCNKCYNSVKSFLDGELVFAGVKDFLLETNQNPFSQCSKLCNQFNLLEKPYISNAVPFMDGDCYCLVNNDANTCTDFKPSCPRNQEKACDKYNLDLFCKPSTFFVLPYEFPPNGGKKLRMMKIVKETDAIVISNFGRIAKMNLQRIQEGF